jgi:hypothetical protein
MFSSRIRHKGTSMILMKSVSRLNGTARGILAAVTLAVYCFICVNGCKSSSSGSDRSVSSGPVNSNGAQTETRSEPDPYAGTFRGQEAKDNWRVEAGCLPLTDTHQQACSQFEADLRGTDQEYDRAIAKAQQTYEAVDAQGENDDAEWVRRFNKTYPSLDAMSNAEKEEQRAAWDRVFTAGINNLHQAWDDKEKADTSATSIYWGEIGQIIELTKARNSNHNMGSNIDADQYNDLDCLTLARTRVLYAQSRNALMDYANNKQFYTYRRAILDLISDADQIHAQSVAAVAAASKISCPIKSESMLASGQHTADSYLFVAESDIVRATKGQQAEAARNASIRLKYLIPRYERTDVSFIAFTRNPFQKEPCGATSNELATAVAKASNQIEVAKRSAQGADALMASLEEDHAEMLASSVTDNLGCYLIETAKQNAVTTAPGSKR